MLDDAAGAGTSNEHLLAGVEVDLAGVAGGNNVVPSMKVDRLRLPEVAIYSDSATWNIFDFKHKCPSEPTKYFFQTYYLPLLGEELDTFPHFFSSTASQESR